MGACRAGEANSGASDVETPVGSGDGEVFDGDIGGFAYCEKEDGWGRVE